MVEMFTKKFAKKEAGIARDMMIFIDHPFCEYYTGHEFDDDIYTVEEDLYKEELRKDGDAFFNALSNQLQKMSDSGCRLVMMEYDPTILAHFGRVGSDYRERFGKFQFFTFFHNDEDTELMCRGSPEENLLEKKELWRSTIAKFAFVNIVEIGLGDVLDIHLADRLYREYPPVYCMPAPLPFG
jgi:hypothetical protein